jgi:hypothetical protein
MAVGCIDWRVGPVGVWLCLRRSCMFAPQLSSCLFTVAQSTCAVFMDPLREHALVWHAAGDNNHIPVSGLVAVASTPLSVQAYQ